ncbi:hypothetical protein J3F84DRAFT_74718 [Trichoderma pleuroticola]
MTVSCRRGIVRVCIIPGFSGPKYSTRSTVHLCQEHRCKDRDRLSPDKHRIHGADSRCITSRTRQAKPAAAQRQNIHPFKHTVSLLACQPEDQHPCLEHRLALHPTNSYNHLLISSHPTDRTTHHSYCTDPHPHPHPRIRVHNKNNTK